MLASSAGLWRRTLRTRALYARRVTVSVPRNPAGFPAHASKVQVHSGALRLRGAMCWNNNGSPCMEWLPCASRRVMMLGRMERKQQKPGNEVVPMSPDRAAQSVTHLLGTECCLCLRTGHMLVGEPAGTRTQDPLIKSQMLYRLSYRLGWEKVRSSVRLAHPGHLSARTADRGL